MAIEAAKKPHFVVVVDEQQLSGTEPESVLIEGLIGIQGRGRSTSPQQLKEVERAVRVLEDLQGKPDPASEQPTTPPPFCQATAKLSHRDLYAALESLKLFLPQPGNAG